MSIMSRKHQSAGYRPSDTAVTVVAAVSLALAGPAVATEEHGRAAADKPTTLAKVQVQESIEEYAASLKLTEPLQDTPQTIQIIDRQLFTQQGATTLSEALRNSAAVGTFYAGENGSTSTGDTVYLRGFDTSASIFSDGIRDVGAISRDLFNVAAVEVEKGPAGTDNGRGAPGGAINTVSKQAFLQDAAASAVSVGLDGQKRITADVNRTLDLTGSALRLNGMWQDSAVPGRDHVKNSRWGIAPSWGVGLDGLTRAYLDLLYVKQHNVPDGLVPTIGLPRWSPQTGLERLAGHPVDPANFYGTRDDHDDVTAQMYTLHVEHDFTGALRLANVIRWGETRQDYLLSSFTVTGGTAADPLAGNVRWTDPADLSTYTLNRSNNNFKDQRNRILTDQLNLRAELPAGSVAHSLSAGLELTREEQRGYNITATGTRPPANLYDPDWNDAGTLTWARNGSGDLGRTDTVALYVFDTVKLGNAVLVTAGLRADRYDTRFRSTAICNDGTGRGAVPCSGATLGSAIQTADLRDRGTLLNWKLGAVYKPVQGLSLYVDFALSQQPPGGANFQLSAAAGNAGNPNLDPQRATTLELGSKWSVPGARLALNLALFQTQITNEINSQLLDENGNPTQTGRKRVRGFEGSLVGNLTRDWSVSAGCSFQDAAVTAGTELAQDGSSTLPYTPRYGLTIWTSYRLPFGLSVGGGWRFVDGLRRGIDGAVGTPSSTGGYGVLDAVVSYGIGQHVALRLNAYNLADRQYVAAINKSGYRYVPGAPRTFLFTAELEF
jgi:catecholate siderophore receptor